MKYSGDERLIVLCVSADDSHVTIAVTDHGIGIPATEHSRIFEKFYRGHGPDHQRVAGTGLGLTLVDHIAKAHGGTVSVSSTPGEGSTFTMRLQTAV